MNKISKSLKEEHPAFMGFTHWLIAVFLFLCLWLTPWSYAVNYVNSVNSDALFLIITFFVIGGAATIADLDSSPIQDGGSMAVYQLGFLGYWLSIAFITISGVVYSLFHTKHDAKPPSQHRMLFHAPIIPILVYIYAEFFAFKKVNALNIIDLVKNKNQEVIVQNIGLFIMLFFCGVSVYLGSTMIVYKVLKLFGKHRSTQFICLATMVGSIAYMVNLPFYKLKIMFVTFALGYLFHIIADVFSKGSCPLFFPIPLPYKGLNFKKLQLWRKPYFISSSFAITTGGAINTILNFVLIGADLFLAWMIFLK